MLKRIWIDKQWIIIDDIINENSERLIEPIVKWKANNNM